MVNLSVYSFILHDFSVKCPGKHYRIDKINVYEQWNAIRREQFFRKCLSGDSFNKVFRDECTILD